MQFVVVGRVGKRMFCVGGGADRLTVRGNIRGRYEAWDRNQWEIDGVARPEIVFGT